MRGTLRVQCDTEIDSTKIDSLFIVEIHLVARQSSVLFAVVGTCTLEDAAKIRDSQSVFSLYCLVAPRTTPRFREFVVVASLLLDYTVFSTLVNKSRYFVTMLLFRLTNRRCLASRHTEHGNASNDQSSGFHSPSTPIGARSPRMSRGDSDTNNLSNFAKINILEYEFFFFFGMYELHTMILRAKRKEFFCLRKS